MKIAFFLILLTAAFAVPRLYSSQEYEFLFTSYISQFQKQYGHDEFHVKYANFMDNMDLIRHHNSQEKSYKLAINEFADLTNDEFRHYYLGYKYVKNHQHRSNNQVLLTEPINTPDEIDWTTKGAVTPVKNQAQCGSCWAFSSTGAMEGAYQISKGSLKSFSEQELVDCSSDYGNDGCNGGLMDYAFQYILDKGGLCSEDDYKYVAYDQSCKVSQCTHVSGSKPSRFVDVAEQDEVALKSAVAITPVSVAIEADQAAFQFYSSGVFDDYCGTMLDHGVLVVGYGEDSSSGKKFWKVKNSWGASWGDHGYIKLIRWDKKGPGQCGLAMQPSYLVY